MTSRIVHAAAIAFAMLASPTAFAAEPVCDAITKAMLLVTDQPGVKQNFVSAEPSATVGIRSVLLKDAMYMSEEADKPWRKMPIDSAMRRKMAEQALVLLPVSACERLSGETVNGVATDGYAFKQPDPLKAGAMIASKIWIGQADGLPRRMLLTDGSSMVFEYGDFKAPTP